MNAECENEEDDERADDQHMFFLSSETLRKLHIGTSKHSFSTLSNSLNNFHGLVARLCTFDRLNAKTNQYCAH